MDIERSEVFSVPKLISSTAKPHVPLWNVTAPLEDLTWDSNFAWLLCALFFAMSWVVYITYYNSRIVGFILTKILNRLYPKGYIKIGSFCMSVLSGKVMFRDVAFINEDFTFRAQDGWLIFCWWKPYFKKDISDDLSHCETRLSLLLNGLELHVYNRSQLYCKLEKLFGLESKLMKAASANTLATKSCSKIPATSQNAENGNDHSDAMESQQSPDTSRFDWKDLVPVVKMEISMGRLVFGNRLLPTTLSVSFEEAIIVYTSKPASSSLDLFTHIFKCTGENFKVLLAPSPKYTGMTDEPPRYMGEGFVVLQSNYVDLYYYEDEPGKVTSRLESVMMANGDIVQKATNPLWGLDIKCGKGTDFSYGPWADRQREQLFKFFFPQEYQTLEPTKVTKIGDLRRAQSFDLRLNTLADATVDILFSKEKETNAIHMNVGPGSYLEATIPWLVKEDGYMSRVCGQLLHLDASTSLQYRSLVESETLQFDIKIHYPLHWNDQQEWQCTLTGCKTTVHLIYSHKVFFQALMEDWASKSRPDLLHFVPYTWHFSLILKEFELILLTNEHNWIDCSSQLQENAQLAICGELFDLSFDLPFVEFLPPLVTLKFWIQGECLALSAHIPEANPSKTSVLIMEECAKMCNRDGTLKRCSVDNDKKWRNITTKSSGWVECWTVPIVALSITYSYYPAPPLGIHGFDMDITTPEKEELLLSPIRPNKSSKKATVIEDGGYNATAAHPITPGIDKSNAGRTTSGPPPDFDPTFLASDKIQMELEIGPSILKLYGALLCYLIQVKDNYLGENQSFTDFASTTSSTGVTITAMDNKKTSDNNTLEESVNGVENKGSEKRFDPRSYRPLDVTVSLTLHDIHGHIMKPCSSDDPPCPFVNLERLCLELHKTFTETRLQLLLSPLIICLENQEHPQSLEEEIGLLYSIDGKPPDPKLVENVSARGGHVVLSGLQVRGHAMFSNCNRTLSQETLEYAWLVEVQLGDITGRLTAPQLQNLMSAMEIFVFQAEQVDSVLQPTKPYRKCQHDLPQILCPQSNVINNPHTASKNSCSAAGGNSEYFSLCPCPEDVKYRMTRVSLDAFDLCLVDNNTAIELEAGPIRLSTCNLHGKDCCSGYSLVVQKVAVYQFISSHNNPASSESGSLDNWLEGGRIFFGPVILDGANGHAANDHWIVQDKFLKTHDFKTKRLWFLWPDELELLPKKLIGRCGCIGGCSFFASDQNHTNFFDVSEETEGGQNQFSSLSNLLGGGKNIFSEEDTNGFGKSLLYQGEHVFDIQGNPSDHGPPVPSLLQGSLTFTEGYLERSASKTPDLSPKHHSESSVGQGITNGELVDGIFTVPVPKPMGVMVKTISSSQKEISLTESGTYHGPADRSSSSPLVPSLSLMSASTDSGEIDVKSENAISRSNLKNYKPEELHNQTTHWHGGGSRRSLTGLLSDTSTMASKGISPRSVRRAISTESTHSSEAYFSADEESSSSVLGDEERTTTAGSVSSSGSYPQEITGNHTYCSETFPTTRVRMAKLGNGSLDRKIQQTGNRQSLEDIEEKPSLLRQSLKSNTSTTSDSQTSASSSGVCGGGPYDHSGAAAESNSVSSSSFISAVSSQEDVALVDLHNQMEKEIVDSPILMSCYTTHLTHVQCHYWNTPLPLPHLFHNEPTSSSSSQLASDRKRISPTKEYLFRKDSTQWKPRFLHVNDGITSIKLIGRCVKPRATRSAEHGIPKTSWSRRKQTKEENASNKEYFIPGSLQQHYKAKYSEDNADITSDRTVYRNTIVVKVEGDINATITPLMLDSLKKFLETLVPAQSNTHPLTLLNHMHKHCAGHVMWQNQLKKEKVLYLCQLQNQKMNTSGSTKNQQQQKHNFRVIGANKDFRDERNSVTSNSDSVGSTTNYEEIRTEHTQAFLDISTINFTVLQAAIVEEVIAFSALDNVKDLTCASLLALRIDTIFVELSKRQHTHRALQTFAQSKGNSKDVKQRNKSENFGVSSAWKTATRKKGKDDFSPSELVTVELKNDEQAEVAFSIKINCVHSQLRRLRNSSSILKEAVLTVIPSRRSRVNFTFDSTRKIMKSSFPNNLNEEGDAFPESFGCNGTFSEENERFGFIMFECGLEDVTVKYLRSKQKPLALLGKETETRNMKESEIPADAFSKIEPSDSGSSQSSNSPGDKKDENQESTFKKENSTHQPSSLAGDLSSLVIELKTVWLNFAAPPKTPNTRKIDFTRLDWHLLSTATPSINAWLKSGNRFQEVLVSLRKMSHLRTCAVLGCLMADALDRQDIHMPVKSKFLHSKLTPLAKTLQEDPSCQLLMVLKRYLNITDPDSIEKNIQPDLIPPTHSLKRGIVALGRQWKNILYMPLLMEQNYRLRRNVPPYSVSFISPNIDQAKSTLEDDKLSLDECEVTDETTNLLMAEGGSIFIHPTTGELFSNGVISSNGGGHDNAAVLGATKSSSTPDVTNSVYAQKEQQENEEEGFSGFKGHTMPSRNKKKLPSYPPRSSRASVAFPLLGGPLDSPARYTNAISKVSGLILPSRSSHAGLGNGSKNKKNESQPSLHKSTTWSLSSIEPKNVPTSIIETPRRTTGVDDYKHNEDLYNWMARQRDDLESTKEAEYDVQAFHRQIEQERLSKMYTQQMFDAGRVSPDQDDDDKASGPLLFGPVPAGLQLADAHEIFAPLFSHLGIEDSSLVDSYAFNMSKKFGDKILVCSLVEVLKVDIVESEYVQASSGRRKKKRQPNGDSSLSTKFLFIDTSMDTPAFVCNKFTLDLSLIQKLDLESSKREPPPFVQVQGDTSGPTHHAHHRRHHLPSRTHSSGMQYSYIWPSSGSSLPLTTVVNFTLNATYIAQQVNMPVLRLLHQFVSMYQNVVETKLELKSKRARSFKDGNKDHIKKSPSAGTESQTESSRPHSPQIQTSSSSSKPLVPGRLSMKSISGGVASLTAGITRTQSLSQKLRTSCNLKGYTNLQEALSSKMERPYSPLSLAISEGVIIDITDSQTQQNSSALSGLPENSEASIDETPHKNETHVHKDFHPHCWKTMYHLLKLYEFRPETKTVMNRIEIKPLDVSENYKGNGKYEQLKDPGSDNVDIPSSNKTHENSTKNANRTPLISLSKGQIRDISKSVFVQERVPLIAFGIIKARRVKLLATLSGLKLETELNGLNSSLTVKERTRGPNRRWSESSLTGQMGHSVVSVLEGVPPNQGVVVKMSVGKSQTLYSSLSKSGKVHNSGLLTIGPIEIDIPQHPVALHGMMARSSRQLSTTLQELRSSRQTSRSSRQMEDLSNFPYYEHLLSPQSHHLVGNHRVGLLGSVTRAKPQLITPIVIQFSIIVDSLTIGAALLPSLKAQYKMGQVTSMGITGSKAKFTVDLPKHTLSFNTNIPTDANLPSSASVDLPPVHISAEYIQDSSSKSVPGSNGPPSGILGGVAGPFGKVDSFTDGVVLRQGNYLSALAEIGSFEHCLTTDLLNHLVLVQKVFMKEVNEVLQKMSGGDKMAPLWNDEKTNQSSTNNTIADHQRLLFSVQLRLKGIQITATTPTSSAVRLETGVVELQVSNRVQNMSVGVGTGSNYIKLFGKAQVDINLSLGQLLKNALFEEAEPEFQQFAYFKTRICMRNALQDEMISSQSEDKEAVLITLIRPLIYLQPVALDKAVLVWLNYKNAYEFWNEQRSAVNKEELLVTQQLLEKVPQISQLGAQSLGTLFLQLTVKDMGICLPLSHPSGFGSNKAYDTELKAAVVVTLESTRVSACSCQSLVSKARFTGLCIRFADDFETSLDDWKPDPMDSSIMNLCVVSEGTYEICSQTLAPQPNSIPPANAKWILNVQWQMEGVDIHVDTNIGKQLSALFKTLTALTGEDEGTKGNTFEGNFENQTTNERRNAMMTIITSGANNGAKTFLDVDCMDGDSSDASEIIKRSRLRDQRKSSLYSDAVHGISFDPSMEAKKRSRLIEKEMNEQAKIINDLRLLGASQSTIEQEMRRLQELEAAVFNDFRRDVIKKIRRQSVKATSFKDKLGLGTRRGGPSNPSMSLFFPDVVLEKPENTFSELDYAAEGLGSFSQDSSPSHDQTRTGSIDIGDLNSLSSPEDKKAVKRESSIDSVFISGSHSGLGELVYSENSTPSHGLEGCSPSTTKLSDAQKSVNASDHIPTSPSTLSSETDQEYPPVVFRARNSKGNDYNLGPLDEDVHGSNMSKPPPTPEPSIDFELDVKVFFNSGKCVFHTKDSYNDDPNKRGAKKERSFSGGFESSSPSHSSKKRHGSGLKLNASSTKLRYLQSSAAGQIADFTIFLIPGLDIKVHYNSKTVIDEIPMITNKASSLKPVTTSILTGSSTDSQSKRDGNGLFGHNSGISANSTQSNFSSNNGHVSEKQQHVTFFEPPVNSSLTNPNSKKPPGVKKASLFAWMTLQSIPEEAVVSPHILDFLEQALEPIPLHITKPPTNQAPTQPNITAPETASGGKATTMVGAATSQYAAYASFPVDVIVYFRMQPSIVRFSCLPVSRVECLLRLPSVDLVFSSKRAEDEPFPLQGTPCEIPKTPGSKSAPGFRKESLKTNADDGNGMPNLGAVAGGLSMTGCLADFSLYIFHPYGGAKKPGGSNTPGGSTKDGETSPLATSERKDSLSLQVEFVKVNISRSRKMNLSFENSSQHPTSVNQSSSSSSTSSRTSQNWSRRDSSFNDDIGFTSVSFTAHPATGAVIRFSAVCDIGSASFKYDMRRLTEILAFPKAWYRRSIARRMFLGEQSSSGALYSDQEDSLETSSSSGTLSPNIGKPDFFLANTPQSTSDASSSNIHTPGEKPMAYSCPNTHVSVLDQLLQMNSGVQHPGFSTTKNATDISNTGDSQSTSTSLGSNSSSTGSGSGSSTNSSVEGIGLRDRVYSHPASLPSMMTHVGPSGREGLRLTFRDTPYKQGFKDQEDRNKTGTMYNTDGSPMHLKGGSAWETLVLFAVSLSRLNVQMNMGNVMGNTTWLTRDFKSQGRLSIGSSGHKNLLVSVGLDGSSLDSKGGIVGGAIELSQIDTYIHLCEDYGQKPDHKVALKLGALEAKLDYMGTSVLMSRVSSLDINLKDEWQISNILLAAASKISSASQRPHHHQQKKGHHAPSNSADVDNESGFVKHPTKRPALIFVHGILGWDQLQLLISKSTTTDLMKMYTKLEEFFSQQFHSSKRVFSSLQAAKLQHHRSIIRRPLRPKPAESGPSNPSPEARHHRHWQKVLSLVSGLNMTTLPSALPTHGTILGGTMELHGSNISLACFHGINFRSKSWAIFSLKEPNIVFSTEAQEVIDKDGSMNTHIVQNLSFGLGQQSLGEQGHHHHQQSKSMATVCKISRNVLFPPQFKTMQEWFHYSFSTSDLDDVNRFPVLEHERESGSLPAHDRRASVAVSKGPELSHNMEVIFALPSLQFHLKTEHFQTGKTPTLNDPKPTVDCSFVTEFDDHIFVSVDAEAFFFLHDLITAYIKEKDSSYSKTQSPDSDRRRKVADPTEALQKDWRDYVCHTWHLEPTVRLLSWAGKGFEPYGVDYILQKLGFSHARVTIPKWTQRGCMDPLDKILSVVMKRMLSAVKEEKDATNVCDTNPTS